eukprot:2090812-Rhodomonas_salina.1
MLGMAAHAVADGADSTALEDLSRYLPTHVLHEARRTAQQAVAPLLGSVLNSRPTRIAQKALKSKDQRAWASYVLASILRVQPVRDCTWFCSAKGLLAFGKWFLVFNFSVWYQAALSSLYVVLPDAVKPVVASRLLVTPPARAVITSALLLLFSVSLVTLRRR